MRNRCLFLSAFILIAAAAVTPMGRATMIRTTCGRCRHGDRGAGGGPGRIEEGVASLGKEIEDLRTAWRRSRLLELLPDVEIYYNSAYYALKYNEFYGKGEFAVAKKHLKEGRERAASLRKDEAPWNTKTGVVVRGYRSKIDGSVQPYGLVVPKTYSATRRFIIGLISGFMAAAKR